MGKAHPAVQEYLDKYPKHRFVIQPFLTCFDVTRASTETNGGTVSAFYLKPEKFMSEQFGIERELLMVYSDHNDFQARTIQLVEVILNQQRIRLDPMVAIIVSEDSRSVELIRDFLHARPDHPNVIAFARKDLDKIKSPDDLRTVFNQQFFQRDLFGLESPLTIDTSFFGRAEIVTELLDRFRAGQNSGLFGLRRIGKTSVLFAIGRRCREGRLGGFLYADLSSPGRYQRRWWELLEDLVLKFVDVLDISAGKSKLAAVRTGYSEKEGSDQFRTDVRRLLNKSQHSKLLVALDEIEYVTFEISPSEHWINDFLPLWQTMRALHQDSEGHFCYIVAGVNPRCIEADRVGKFDNPLFSTARPYFLPPFELDKVREMVRRLARYMGLKTDETLYPLLTKEYGGHPFLVRQACSLLSKKVPARPGQLTTSLFQSEREQLGLLLEKNVRQILNVLAIWYPDEYEMIRTLATGGLSSFLEFARLDPEFTQHVEGYGLVRAARSNPTITIGLVESFLQRQPVESQETSGEDVLAEISRRRNTIEKKLRVVLRDGLKFKHGKKGADALLRALPQTRREVVARFSYEDVWEHLFFDELTLVLEQEWDAFQNWFSEPLDEVLRWMNHVNKSRSDAHAKSIGKDDLAYLRICFSRLEEKVVTRA